MSLRLRQGETSHGREKVLERTAQIVRRRLALKERNFRKKSECEKSENSSRLETGSGLCFQSFGSPRLAFSFPIRISSGEGLSAVFRAGPDGRPGGSLPSTGADLPSSLRLRSLRLCSGQAGQAGYTGRVPAGAGGSGGADEASSSTLVTASA